MRLLLLAFSFLVVPLYSLAAIPPNTTALAFSLSPTFPRPHDTVTATLSSSVLDFAGSPTKIFVDGELKEEGLGVTHVTFQVGDAGVLTKVKAVVTNPDRVYETEFTIRPAEVALITEAFTTTHPLYKGGALPSSESRVKLVAIPNFKNADGSSIPVSNLIFSWQLGVQSLLAESGAGKSVLSASAPLRYRDAEVTLTVTDANRTIGAQTKIAVAPIDPVVRVYRTSPLLGTWYGGALSGTIVIGGAEETYRVVPYYFASTPNMTWGVNGSPSGITRDLTVRPTGNGSGSASVSITARLEKYFQTASQNFSVNFSNQAQTGFFGF